MTASDTVRLLDNGPEVAICKTIPCPFCAIGLHHELTIDEEVEWWRARSDDFVNRQDPHCEGPWHFFIQAMAMRLIMRIIQEEHVSLAPVVLVARAEQCGDDRRTMHR